MVLKASNRAEDAQSRSTARPTKIESQLNRYMSRLRERRSGDGERRSTKMPPTRCSRRPADAEAPRPNRPPIVAETRVDIPEASVSDAVMMLDLRNTNALMFRNSRSGAFNMVYRRDDGTIGWVEPTAQVTSPAVAS